MVNCINETSGKNKTIKLKRNIRKRKIELKEIEKVTDTSATEQYVTVARNVVTDSV